MKPFKTDNMTAQDILNMNIDDLIFKPCDKVRRNNEQPAGKYD